MPQPATRHESFIVRLTVERAASTPTDVVVRGQVEDVRTGQSWRFAALDDVAAILSACLRQRLIEGDLPGSVGKPEA